MKIVLNILIIALLLAGGCRMQRESSFRAGYDFSGVTKVAIVSVEGAVPSEAAKDEIADFFAIELLERGYAPMGRAQVRASLAEQESGDEISDLTTPEGAVEAGLALDVPAVLTIKIPHFGEEISISATMIDVEDRSILWLATDTGRGGGGFSSIFSSKSCHGRRYGLDGTASISPGRRESAAHRKEDVQKPAYEKAASGTGMVKPAPFDSAQGEDLLHAE